MVNFKISPIKSLPFSFMDQVREIFFEASPRKEFKNENEKLEFQWKYLDFYEEHFSEYFFLAYHEDKVLGYIAGAPYTLGLNDLWKSLPHLEIFSDQFEKYPAHLHINLAASSRGLGVGSVLLKSLENKLLAQDIHGIHLITSSTAKNVTFYLKNNYNYQVERLFQGHPLLFMAKSL